jgi:hypothetical protein
MTVELLIIHGSVSKISSILKNIILYIPLDAIKSNTVLYFFSSATRLPLKLHFGALSAQGRRRERGTV